jgi:hypothetical protein
MDYRRPVRFGVFINPIALAEHLLGVAVLADELGFDLLGLQDHPIRRILNAGADVPVDLFTSLTVEHGMDTYVIGGLEEPDALRWFVSDIIPAVREAVVQAR